MAKEDQQLPLSRHVVSAFKDIHFVKDMIAFVFMWSQEVIVSNPQGQVIVGAVNAVKSVCRPVRSFVCAVEPLNHLLERSEFSGYRIVVGKTDYLSDAKFKSVTKFMEKLLGCQWIGAIAVSDKAKAFRKFFEMPESHAHCHDAGAYAAVIGDPVAKDGTLCGIHDKPDIGFNAADLDIGFISGENIRGVVIVIVHKRLYTDSGGFTVIGDLLM